HLAAEPGTADIVQAAGNVILPHVASIDFTGDDAAGVKAGSDANPVALRLPIDRLALIIAANVVASLQEGDDVRQKLVGDPGVPLVDVAIAIALQTEAPFSPVE